LFRAGIYIGWIGYSNLGDDSIYEQCRRHFPNIHWSPFLTLDYSVKPGQFIRRGGRDAKQILRMFSDELSSQRRLRSLAANSIHRLARFAGGEVGICGGEINLNRNTASLRAYREVRQRTGFPVPVFGTGVAHPDFWLGREDGWVDRRKEWVDLLAELPTVGVRGPFSKAYLEETGARNVVVCGDPAVSYHSRYANQELRTPRDGPLRIGINAGFYPRAWGRPQDVHDSLVGLAQWLGKAGHQIQIVPAWARDFQECMDVARDAGLDRSAVVSACSSPEDFLNKIENFDLFVALNMHTGILAAVANIPFVGLEYHPKCRDFAATAKWEDFFIRTDELNPRILIDRVAILIAQLDTKRRELCCRLCELQSTFEGYCKDIAPLLLSRK